VSHLREKLSLAEQKIDSMEYEISGLRQKMEYQEKDLSSVRAQLEKSEEQSQEYGDLLILSNKRADEISDASAQYQKSAGDFEKEFASKKQDLQQALTDISERDKIISELRMSLEEQTKEIVSNGKEISNGKKQLKALTEKSERLSKENRTLIDRVQELQQASRKSEVENPTQEDRSVNAAHDPNDTTVVARQKLAEVEKVLETTCAELELEKQRTKALADQVAVTQSHRVDDTPLESTKTPLQSLQIQLDVERSKSREILGQLESVRSEMTELRRRYMYILEENKQLNELVEAEIFEGDEFGAGMKDFEVNGTAKYNPSTTLSPGLYGKLRKIVYFHSHISITSNQLYIASTVQLNTSKNEGVS
jgi:chromosome segregation ATPase